MFKCEGLGVGLYSGEECLEKMKGGDDSICCCFEGHTFKILPNRGYWCQ
jgi:hypothetical protein